MCFAADVGQGEELSGLNAKAVASGALKCVVKDLREEFAKDYLFKLVQSSAIYERRYLLGTSIARPLIATHQVKVAEAEGADAVAHGCTGKGNDQVRFELTYTALNPKLKIIAPWRDPAWQMKSREDALDVRGGAQRARDGRAQESIYSPRPQPVAHVSHEGGLSRTPNTEPG